MLFLRGGAWHEQRNHRPLFDKNAVDYATIIIGLYGAATEMRIDRLLELQNKYRSKSNYADAADILFDNTYTYLPFRDVYSTRLGAASTDECKIINV